MDGSSFSFTCVRDAWNWDTRPAERRLLEVALVDVGPVSFPAYSASTAAARALDRIATKLNRPVDELVAALGTGEMRSLMTQAEVDPAAEALRAEVLRVMDELRAMDMGGDSENLEAGIGAVLQAHHARLGQIGLKPSGSGSTVRPIADQDGDQDGDGQTLWLVDDENGTFYYTSNGGNADFVASNAGWRGPLGPGGDTAAPMEASGRSATEAMWILELHEREGRYLAEERARDKERDEERGASGSTTLPLGTRTETWNAGSAAKSLQPGDFSKAFFWRDPTKPADQIGAYKLPFGERGGGMGDGSSGLHAVWAGVHAAAAAIQGARGGVSIPEADVGGVKSRIAAYYSKARTKYNDDSIKVPWS
jgi:hypothetical protein